MFWRNRILKEIEALDPVKDHLRIVYLSGLHEFPWESTRSLEFALFRTFAVPSIGKLLDRTGEFNKRSQKRYDDTDLILAEIVEHGYDSERGARAINRMNAIHSNFNISNDDFLYVLGAFLFEPKRFINQFGHRKTTRTEDLAAFEFWKQLGTRMHIKGIPETRSKFRAFFENYEEEHFQYTDAARRIADSTMNMFMGWILPKFLFPIARPFMLAIMDEPLLRAIGYKKAPAPIRLLVRASLKSRAYFLRIWPVRKTPATRTDKKHPSYPNGYTIEELGPKGSKPVK